MRLNKYLSLCGVTSRRGADALIAEGRVAVNDCTVEKQGRIIDETTDVVRVDGVEVRPVEQKLYVAFNKPRLVMTTLHDPFRRRTIVHYLKGLKHRVYPIGRLDYDTEGILLLTNDGELAYRLAHPKFQIRRIYEARVQGRFTRQDGDSIVSGILLDGGKIGRAEQVSVLGIVRGATRVRMVLTEGRKREVKELCAKVGHPVIRLIRTEFAGISSRGLRTGQYRELQAAEVSRLKNLVGLPPTVE